MRSLPLLQSELSFQGDDPDALRNWLRERRKTRLQRFGDWMLSRLLNPLMDALYQAIAASRALEVVPAPIWTLASMLISIALYSLRLGWMLATGFIILLFVHECGHLLAARWYGVRMSVPIFIPFLGAIIDMKNPMRSAWEKAVIGISGPILGTLGACLCWSISSYRHSFYFAELAFFGCFLNLFNLIPLGELDGGHIAAALTRWLWVPGLVIMAVFVWFIHSPAAIVVLLFMLPMVLGLFRKKTPKQLARQQAYDRISIVKRFAMGALYFGLITLLAASMCLIFARDIAPVLKADRARSVAESGSGSTIVKK